MAILTIDVGGSAIKNGVWSEGKLTTFDAIPTPKDYETFKQNLLEIKERASQEYTITGIGMSMPGAVNTKTRQIEGVSAVPYIHHRPIFDELETLLELPLTIENDANCAGICEVEIGAGRQGEHIIFIILGTGVGGSIFIHRKLYKGAHLFGGEFGLMRLMNKRIFSTSGTAVAMAHMFNQKYGTNHTGLAIFEEADSGSERAVLAVDELYENISEGLYNIQVAFDPDTIVIGGGISQRHDIAEQLRTKLFRRLQEERVESVMPKVVRCDYLNDANLIGAALNFENQGR